SAYARVLLLAPSADPRWTKAVLELAAEPKRPRAPAWGQWLLAFARVRVGRESDGLVALGQIEDPNWKWPVAALANHALGRTETAKEALHEADLAGDRVLFKRLTDSAGRLWSSEDIWVYFRALRREAHRAINAEPLPDSPSERLFRGRVLQALGKRESGEAEFAAAIALRPNDPNVWIARARIFSDLGWKDRMATDRVKAQTLKGD